MKRTRLIYKICHIRFRGNFLNLYIVYLDIFQHSFSQHLNAVLWFSKWVTRGVTPVELFQILKDDAVKSSSKHDDCRTQYASKFGNLSSGHRTGKGQFSFQSQRKAMPKNVQTTTQLHSSHMLVK